MYPYVHYKCSNKLLRKLETLKVIDILSIEGTQIKYKFNDSFEKHLDKTLDHTRHHIITDETVDDDLVTLQGVLRTIADYLSKETPQESIYRCAEFVFNSLMTKKYGGPVPKDKRFKARSKEFFEEVHSIDVTEEVLYQRVFGNKFPKDLEVKRSGKLLPSTMVSKKLDEELDKGTSNILGVIEKLAIRMEKKFGASKKWRHFRMDELVLQTIQSMIMEHLRTAPIAEIILGEMDIQMLNNSIESLFVDITEVSSILAKKHKIPLDVVLARILNNVMMNLVLNYVKMKSEYAKRHGST
jgi:hypothetical protein